MPDSKSTNKQAKQSRSQPNSGDMDEPSSSDISESMNSIKRQLKKLDLLEQLVTDIKDLKQSVEFNNSLIEMLKADNASLRAEVNDLKQLTAELQKDNITLSKDILYLQSQDMKNNLIIHGLPEVKNETYQRSEELLKTFLINELKMKSEDVGAICFSRVNRIGRTKVYTQRPRPLVAKVVDFKMKSAVMSRGKELKGTSYSISNQFPSEIMNRRRRLYPVMEEARKNKKNIRLITDKLYIDGKLYRNPQVTYWISGGDENTNFGRNETSPPKQRVS